MSVSFLEEALYHTVRYYDIFDQAVTPVQMWRCLIMPPGKQEERWGGHRTFGLKEIREMLQSSSWLKERLDTRDGFYVLKGKLGNVIETRKRMTEAQMKWKQARRLARWLMWVPGVQMLAVSGSLAANHTRKRSDIDLLVVTAKGRIWLTRLLLLCAAQITGKRRKYWHKDAPGKLCLNHYLAEDALVINPEIRNIYTAMMYHNLTAITGLEKLRKFRQVNRKWAEQFIMRPTSLAMISPVQAVKAGSITRGVRRIGELMIAGKIGEMAERGAEWMQRQTIKWHNQPHVGGRVAVSAWELAFHPGSKSERVAAVFNGDSGQERLI